MSTGLGGLGGVAVHERTVPLLELGAELDVQLGAPALLTLVRGALSSLPAVGHQ